MSDDKEKEKPYHWFQGDSVVELYKRLSEYGPQNARLEVRTKGDQMYLSVRGDEDPPINDSRLCPPICG